MKKIPVNAEMLRVAQRIVWFKEPNDAIQNPIHFLTYAMRYGTLADLTTLEKNGIWLDEFREALDAAPPGVLDERSWSFWQLKCGRPDAPPLPHRNFSNTL